jgi:DNA-binding CsgD family transcriptional regulator/transcriptional regulator of acetoin/glycerol metabolism
VNAIDAVIRPKRGMAFERQYPNMTSHLAEASTAQRAPADDLVAVAKPVIERLSGDLSGTDTRVVLSDAGARIVASLQLLEEVAVASAPVNDPRTGQVLGAISLVCPVESVNSLLLPVARRAAREVEHRLLDGSSHQNRLLEEHFLRARRRARCPLVAVSERSLLMNAAAARLVDNADQAQLWDVAERAIKVGSSEAPSFELTHSQCAAFAIEVVCDGDEIVGTILHLRWAPDAAGQANDPLPGRARSDRPTFGWASLTESEWALADLVAEGLTNRQAAARLFLSHHTVDTHLRHIFRKLDINSRVELAALVVAHRRAVA